MLSPLSSSRTLCRLTVSVFALASAALLNATVSCPPIFGSHMVLQRELPVPVWGTASPGEKVSVEFAGQTVTATTDATGQWRLQLAPLAASAEPRRLVVRGTNELPFDDVLVGEVWLCSGQSNMEKQLGPRSGQQPTDNYEEETRNADHPLLRLYQVPRHGRKTADDLTLAWHACTPEVVTKLPFTAAGYFFGRELRRELGVPIGLVHVSYGGTRIEPWTSPTAYDGDPSLAPYAAASAGNYQIDGTQISGLYRSMVAPLVPFAVRGFIWYQGESNLLAGDVLSYPAKMRALVGGWRSAWDRADAPFYYVQLAPHLYSARKAVRPLSPEALPLFWEQQTKALQIPHSGMIVITDTVTRYADIHPTDKLSVGRRLARLALARDYGRTDLADSGPTLRDFSVRGSEIELTFEHAAGLTSRDGKPLTDFLIAGEDRHFVPANAVIRNDRVVVSAPAVPKPVAVRIAWTEESNPNLVNASGLPVRSARTDTWPVSLFRETNPSDGAQARRADPKLPDIPAYAVRLTDFGASNAADALNTSSFASAIAAVSAHGGGRVDVPAGTWRTGPIVLRSKVELHLERGATIQFSDRRDDYLLVETNYEGRMEWRCQSPLSGVDLEDVAITGEGTIDGAGEVWRPVKRSKQTPEQWAKLVASGGVLNAAGDIWYPSAGSREGNETASPRQLADPARRAAIKDALRPVLLSLRGCRRVLLEGVTFQNSPSWCLHPLLCEQLTVRGITARNPWYAQNGDGLDVDSCRYVLIERSTFDVGDDAICLKSGRDEEGRRRGKPTEYVVVRNCTVHHGHGGFVVGSEMSGGVRNVQVNDCDFSGTDVGLRFKSNRGRGGVVENITIERIKMDNIVREAVVFDLFYGGERSRKTPPTPRIDESTPAFRNIVMSELRCNGAARAALLQGLPEMPLENVRIDHSSFVANEGLLIADTDGLLVQHVAVTVTKGPALDLRGARQIAVSDVQATVPAGRAVVISGSRSSDIQLPANLEQAP